MKRITSLQHPLVKHLVKLKKERSYRQECHRAVIEGKKVCSEIPSKTLLSVTEKGCYPCEERILVSDDIIKKISSMHSSEGVIAEVETTITPIPSLQKLLVLDGISDPGNLGVLIRTALALKWEGIFLLNNCCDPYNDKALTAARGATFKLPIQQGLWNDLEKIQNNNDLKPYVADIKGVAAEKVKEERILLVLGNEARGPSEESLKRCLKITIPMAGNMESLNVAVAGGILMYVL